MKLLRYLHLTVTLAAIALPLAANAQSGLPPLGFDLGSGSKENFVKASAVFTAPAIGKPAMLYVTAEMTPGWHIYSITQAPDGPIRTKIKFATSTDYKLAGEFKSLDAPTVHQYPEAWPNLPVEEHERKVTWAAPIEIAAGVNPAKLEISGAVYAQVCAKECLMPQDYKFTARLGSPPKLPDRAVSTSTIANTDSAAPPVGKANSTANELPGVTKYKAAMSHVTLTGSIEPAVAKPGSVARLVIKAEPAPGWHVYALAEKDPNDVSKPTLIVLTETTGLRYRPATPSHPPVEKPTTVNQSGKDRYHERPVSWTIDLEVPPTAKPGEFPIAGIIGFQSCSETTCDPPLAASFRGTLTVVDGAGKAGAPANASAPLLFRDGKYSDAAKLAEKNPESDATKTNEPTSRSTIGSPTGSTGGGFDESQVSQNVQANFSFWELVLGAFFGGLLLNLMPCVFPVIGLKVLSFVEQSHHDRRRLLILNLWYSLGVVLLFLALAATAVVLRQFFDIDFKYGSQNGIAGFAVGMAAVMFVMALSLLGVWEIPIPGFLGSGKVGATVAHEGAAGAVAKGAVTTLLGASCSGPLVAVAFAFALDRNTPPWATFCIFALIGLGMSSPYLILGANPRLLRFLPRPGVWMDTFKHVCGFVLLGAMVWVLTWLRMEYIVPTVAFLVGLWAACWWIGRTPLTEPLSKRLQAWGWAIVFCTAVGLFAFNWLAPAMLNKFDDQINREIAKRVQMGQELVGAQSTANSNAANDSRLPWQPFSKDLLKQLTREGKTVMVDFTADWCPNCKALEHYVLNTSDIKSVVTRNGIVPLVADYTETPPPPELTEMLNLMKAGAVPVLAIFPAGDPNNPIIFRGGYTTQTLIDALNKAGPSQAVATRKETAMK